MTSFLIFGLAILLASFRFYHLGYSEFYHDEAASLTVATGHSPFELEERLLRNGGLSAAETFREQQIDPNSHFFTAVFNQMRTDPLHPPIYFIALRLWTDAFGDSPFAARSLSVLLGLVTVATIWLLTMTLFQSRRAAGLAALFAAASPLLCIVATTAREYALWLPILLLCTRQLYRRHWRSYFVLAAMALYTSLLSIPVLLAHGIYVWRKSNLEKSRPWFWALLMVTIPILLFVGFYWSGFRSMHWMSDPVPPTRYFGNFVVSFVKLFVDTNFSFHSLSPQSVFALALTVAILLLEGFAGWHLFRSREHRSITFLFGLLLIATFLPTLGADLIFGGSRGMSVRYHFFAFTLIEIGVAAFLASHWRTPWQKTAVAFSACLILTAGVWSESQILTSPTWWNKSFAGNAYDIATKINAGGPAIVLADDLYNLISISRYLKPNTRLMTTDEWHIHAADYKNRDTYYLRAKHANVDAFKTSNHMKLQLITPGLFQAFRAEAD